MMQATEAWLNYCGLMHEWENNPTESALEGVIEAWNAWLKIVGEWDAGSAGRKREAMLKAISGAPA